MNTQIIVAVSFIIIATVVMYLLTRLKHNKIKKTYTAFASSQGLNFTFDNFLFRKRPEITGTFEGYRLHVLNKSDGAIEASERYYFTIAELSVPEFELGISISKENLIKGVGKFFGYQDIETGVHQLDKSYVFQSNQPEKFTQLIASIDHQLFDKSKFGKHISYEEGKFICKTKGIVKSQSDMAKLEGMLQICVALAKRK